MFTIYRTYGTEVIIETEDNIPNIFGACAIYTEDNDLTDLVVFDNTTGAVIINYHRGK